MKKTICWLFCTVIDNFGDIGVSWRLACELRARLGVEVWLWLDDLSALRQLVPDAPAALPDCCHGIHLAAWREGTDADLSAAPPPDIVIETFACTLPPNVLQIVRRCRPLWLNWEYLSAEEWAVRSHAMPSLQADGSAKYFWQMGFTEAGGGLLREADYAEKKRLFDARKQSESPTTLHFYAFGYAADIWADWCAVWQQSGRAITLHLAGSPIQNSLNAFRQPENPAQPHSGSLKTVNAPFVPQARFDEQLWAADLLMIRGEDSFIRAQYAAKPFFWHIYPQAELAHLDKLDAFWQLYWQTVPASGSLKTAHTALSYELNGAQRLSDSERAAHWRTLLDNLSEWQHAADCWQQYLFGQSDAVSRLACFIAKQK